MYTHKWRKTCFLQEERGMYTMLSAPTTYHVSVTYVAPVNPTMTKQPAAQAAAEATSPAPTSKQLQRSSKQRAAASSAGWQWLRTRHHRHRRDHGLRHDVHRTPHTPGYTRVNTNTTTDETTGCVTACAAPHAHFTTQNDYDTHLSKLWARLIFYEDLQERRQAEELQEHTAMCVFTRQYY